MGEEERRVSKQRGFDMCSNFITVCGNVFYEMVKNTTNAVNKSENPSQKNISNAFDC